MSAECTLHCAAASWFLAHYVAAPRARVPRAQVLAAFAAAFPTYAALPPRVVWGILRAGLQAAGHAAPLAAQHSRSTTYLAGWQARHS
jgi:hypothetical protein